MASEQKMRLSTKLIIAINYGKQKEMFGSYLGVDCLFIQ
jgi:hypothetical protein